MSYSDEKDWALILGGSSGFGLAVAKKLARDGMSICVVHRDRKGSMERIEKEFEEIRSQTKSFFSLNVDALGLNSISRITESLREKMRPDGKVRVLLHSIAYGNLKPIAPPLHSAEPSSLLEDEDMSRTIYAMGSSLLFWVQHLNASQMFSGDTRIFGLTSEGNSIVWKGYAAVSAAKATLESVARAISVEFAPYGLRCNILQPGVTDTPALRLIPGHEEMLRSASKRNPFGRLTAPEDVANVVSLLSRPEARWINGTVIRVDGGEHIVAG